MSRPNGRLLLFIADNEPNSRRAKSNLRSLPPDIVENSYEVEIIDVLENHLAAIRHNILVTPSLLVQRHGEEFLVLGDLSDVARVQSLLQMDEPINER